MIYGVGIDIVSISRIASALSRWGDAFKNRVFTKNEISFCMKRPRPEAAFSMRFAAKEAFSKALGTGMKQGVRWRDIEIQSLPSGKPVLNIYGRAYEHILKRGIRSHQVSLSDEKEFAIAIVILEV